MGCEEEGKWCDKPYSGQGGFTANLRARFIGYACTPCYTPQELMAVSRKAVRKTTLRYGAILPKLSDPRVVSRFTDLVEINGAGQIFSSAFGWLVKARHLPGNHAPLSVAPTNLPAVGGKLSEKSHAVGILLEEQNLNQYWVVVTESHPWCILNTPEWEVLVARLRA